MAREGAIECARWGGNSGRFCLFLASEAPEEEEGKDQMRRMQSLPVWIEGGGGRAHSKFVSIEGGATAASASTCHFRAERAKLGGGRGDINNGQSAKNAA